MKQHGLNRLLQVFGLATIAKTLPGSNLIERWWNAVDRRMEWLGDRINPILVKETRQALKSKQFTVTFGLVLAFGWIWSIFGVAMMGEGVQTGTHGDDMFFGYFCILSFPLLVIVPFGAFRSLAGEQEDRTYELMSITTLGPHQIILGKLGSSVLQMAIYLSAISPCLAFTYLLRGIDFPTILFVLSYVIQSSLGAAMMGLFVGTLTTQKHWQIIISVLLIIALLWGWGSCLGITLSMFAMGFGLPFADWEFWTGCAGFLTGFVGYFFLIFFAAAARITFTSGNRSTRLRITMLAHQAALAGWMGWMWMSPYAARWDPFIFIVFLMMVGIHWYVMGMFMIGESPDLSARVKRNLPQSHLGRALFTWFNPGPGTGYVFAITSLTGAVVLAMIGVAAAQVFDLTSRSPWTARYVDTIFPFALLGLSYVVIYLGIGLLLIRTLRKFSPAGIPLSVLLQVLLLMIGCGVPVIIHLMSPSMRYDGYTLLQVTNPIWTLGYITGGRMLPPQTPVLMILLPGAALLVFVLNLRGIVHEVRQVRIDKPWRVAEEDAQQWAAKHPVEPVKTSPWD